MAPVPQGSKIAAGAMAFRRLAKDQAQRRRLIVSIEGEEKSGKNHFAFGAPGPIYFHSFDYGDEGVIEKFLATGKEINKAEYRLQVPPGTSVQDTSNAATPIWNGFKANLALGMARGGTTIVDTGTDAYEMIRLSYFGKLAQVMPHHYAPVNAEFKNIFRDAYSGEGNLILLHRVKEEWINKMNKDGKEVGIKTGRLLLAGYKDTPYETQVHLRAYKDADGFHMEVVECRQNPELAGFVLDGELNSFAGLGTMVYPDSAWEEWL